VGLKNGFLLYKWLNVWHACMGLWTKLTGVP
jgi:hypothetical protein